MSSKRRVGGPKAQLSESNHNADCVDESVRFKFVDDLTFLEIIYLLNVGLATYNVRQHVPSLPPVIL
jgi:hypothetical protein